MHPPTSSSLETHDPFITLSSWTDKRGIPERPEVSGVPGFSWKIVMRTCYVCARAYSHKIGPGGRMHGGEMNHRWSLKKRRQ
jgi:hypothetical protein